MNFPSKTALGCFFLVFILWAIHEFFIEKNRNSNKEKLSKPLEENNRLLFYGTLLVMGFMFAFLIINLFIGDWFLYPNPILSYVGSFIGFLGLVIRWWAIDTLKGHFDTNIQIKENQILIRKGLFAYIRHPSYAGSALTYIGLGVASLNMMSAVVLTVFIFSAYYSRIKLEEAVLRIGFGDAYIKYQESTGALFPKLPSISMLFTKK